MIETHWHWKSNYQTDLSWQLQRHQDILAGTLSEALLFAEHLPCITMGKRGGELKGHTATPIFQINRGGFATWHGPGQLVLYPLLHLQRRGLGTKSFVSILEEALLQTLREYGVQAVRREKYPGIWWQGKKLASLGLEIKKGISMHGCAININNNLQGFQEIIPCGFDDIEMISLSQIQGDSIPLYDFGCKWQKKLRQCLC